jgi:hypothetical protein
MVRELQERVDTFAREASLTRCFLHVVNLVARTTIRVFDVPPKKKSDDATSTDGMATSGDPVLDQARAELRKLAENLELEEAETRATVAQEAQEAEGGDDGDFQDELENSTEGWVDERDLMSEDERDELDKSVLPVRLAILKVRGRRVSIVLYTHVISCSSAASCMPSSTPPPSSSPYGTTPWMLLTLP